MKGNFFRYLTKRGCLLGLAAASVLGASLALTSCSGGDGSEASYIVQPNEFASGAKSFYILANNMWTLHATEPSGLIMSGPDHYMGTVAAWGEVTTGSFDKDGAGKAIVLFHYHYDKETNTATLEWSWDSADPENAPKPALAYITTIHNYAGAGNEEAGNQTEGDNMEGVGKGDDPLALAEHYRMPRVKFDFNTGQCVLYCGCGSYTHNLHFEVRAN